MDQTWPDIYYWGQIWTNGQIIPLTLRLASASRTISCCWFGSLGSGPYWSLRREETPSRLSAIMTYFKLASSGSSRAARLSTRPCMTKRLLTRRRHQLIKINRATESTQQHSCYVMQRCPSYTPVLPFLPQKLRETDQTISCFTHKQLQALTNEWRATF